jgi:hypothetical protein
VSAIIFRRWLANRLVRIARRIYPDSDEVMSFWTDRMMELVLTGQSTIKIESVQLKDEDRPKLKT